MEKIGSFFMVGMTLFVFLALSVGWLLSKEYYLTAETRALQSSLLKMPPNVRKKVITILLNYEKK